MSTGELPTEPVPTHYVVTVKFSDEEEPTVEKWYGKDFADRAADAWLRIEKVDREYYDAAYRIEWITVTPGYGTPEGYVFR